MAPRQHPVRKSRPLRLTGDFAIRPGSYSRTLGRALRGGDFELPEAEPAFHRLRARDAGALGSAQQTMEEIALLHAARAPQPARRVVSARADGAGDFRL